MKFGIIGAMEIEVSKLLEAMKSAGNVKETEAGSLKFFEGKINNTDVVVVRSGVGKVNAALCAQRLILSFGCEFIINSGIAGAMASGLGVLDVVLSSDAVYHDMDATGFGYKPTEVPQMACSAFPADTKMIEKILKIFPTLKEAEGHKLVVGRVATGDQFISDKAVKEHIKEICSPACVEMEGAAIAHACWLNKTPFVIIRTLSDMADDSADATYQFNENTAADLSAAIMLALLKQF